jgi:hypothetical protein
MNVALVGPTAPPSGLEFRAERVEQGGARQWRLSVTGENDDAVERFF